MYTLDEKIAISNLISQRDELTAIISELSASNISDQEYYCRVAELECKLLEVESDLDHLTIPGEDTTIYDWEIREMLDEDYPMWDF